MYGVETGLVEFLVLRPQFSFFFFFFFFNTFFRTVIVLVELVDIMYMLLIVKSV